MPSAAFLTEMDRKRGSQPRTKIEHISKLAVTTDISLYFSEGANLETVKERAPDEIQAGEFDVVLFNHDDTFSEFKSGSLFFETDYHGSQIRISQGFVLPDGTTEFEVQGVGFIDELITDPDVSKVTLRCRDLLWRIMDQQIHSRPEEEVPIKNANNIGNGVITAISTKPFDTINEDWTLACTLGGGDGVATFSVVGSDSGSIGPATSGTEFVAGNDRIRFKLKVGSTIWVVGDEFTFSTKQYPQWEFVNAGKIIWSVLTGYNWDTDTQEVWSGLVFDYDRTQSSANTELDYDSFVDSIANIDSVGFFELKGFAAYDDDAIKFMQNILLLFLGSIYTGNDGRIQFKTYIPQFGEISRSFTDDKKIKKFYYNRTVDEIINSVSVKYVATEDWPWSNQSLTLDGVHVDKNATSISQYRELKKQTFNVPWYTTSGAHVQDFADKLVSKYAEPPVNISYKTGMDALTTQIGDKVIIVDTKLGVNAIGEVALVNKQFDLKPVAVSMIVRRDSEIDQQFGFIGSDIDEGDGLSPQSDDYSTASDSDRAFAYLGSLSDSEPDYRIF